MICDSCAKGGKLATRLTRFKRPLSYRLWDSVRRKHAACMSKSCTCQHRVPAPTT